MNDNDSTSSRKSEHVRIVLNEDVGAKGIYSGFAAYRLPHDALPGSTWPRSTPRRAARQTDAGPAFDHR